MSKKNFCHIRFKGFEAVDRAISISGTYVKVNADLVPSAAEWEAANGSSSANATGKADASKAASEEPPPGSSTSVAVDDDSDDIIVLEAVVDVAKTPNAPTAVDEQKKKQQQRKEIRNPFRIHVDFAAARDDKHEWDCMQRAMAREERHR